MNTEEKKKYVLARSYSYMDTLGKDGSGKGWVCPLCQSGSGAKGTGITTKDGVHFTCWVCGEIVNADIIDIIGKQYGLESYSEKLNKAYELVGGLPEDEELTKKAQMKQEEPEEDLTDFFLQAQAHINDTDYHRGLSGWTLKYYGIGFVKEWVHPKTPHVTPTPRLIIPTGKGSYVARYTGDDVKVIPKMKVGHGGLYNAGAFKSNTPFFIVEGQIDALSVIDCGVDAVGLGTATNAAKVEKYTKDITNPVILTLDVDEAGQKALQKVKDILAKAHKPYVVYPLPEGVKDPNEYLMTDRKSFERWVDEGIKRAEMLTSEVKKSLLQASAKRGLDELLDEIRSGSGDAIPTGFKRLDMTLDGGLRQGLYIIGAIPSLGKTTFMLQLADQIAEKGKPVMVFSLEMSRGELITKSISRHTKHEGKNPKTFIEVMRDRELDGIGEAVKAYNEYSDRVYIYDTDNKTIESMREKIDSFVSVMGESPVVIVDYLQIIHSDAKLTDKEKIDRCVTALKNISNDYKTPVMTVSSFNRNNYKEDVNMASFKESGAIEYGADVLIGLEYQKKPYTKLIGKKPYFDENAARQSHPRRVQINIIKNRNGQTGARIGYDFFSRYSYFSETGEINADEYITDDDVKDIEETLKALQERYNMKN